ncbi:hypothetical protein WJX77_007362 [Trebouxia sp. C0004]
MQHSVRAATLSWLRSQAPQSIATHSSAPCWRQPKVVRQPWKLRYFRQAVQACGSASLGRNVPASAHRMSKVDFRHVHAKSAAAQAPTLQKEAQAESPASSELQLYNTMGRRKQVFTPRQDQGQNISMYVCGVTVYDWAHIGHARVYISFDVLHRYLKHLGYNVQYVRNFTDIDDKIIARAKQSDEDPLSLSRRFIVEFHKDMEALGCLPPTLEPKATDHVPDMVATIEQIIANDHGYAVGGDVFFDVASLPGYGRLSGRAQEDNRAGERVALDSRKRNPSDFALWKSAKPGEPTWDSPWGPGRPGWHIECSAMIRRLMGAVIDIHGGGFDLIFPHHENEIAQSQACACDHDKQQMTNDGIDFVRFWLHNGFVNVDSEKMSKSLGNFFTIRDVTVQYHPLVLRWFLLNTQYRQAINYSQPALDEAAERLYYIYQTLLDTSQALKAAASEGERAQQEAADNFQESKGEVGAVLQQVHQGMCDDLNTPLALAALSAPLKAMNDLLSTKKGKKAKGRLHTLAQYQLALQETFRLLGMQVTDPHEQLDQMRQLALSRANMTEEDVAAAIDRRAEARQAKDYSKADAVRAELSKKGLAIMDTAEGVEWRPTTPEL